jgi:transcriptional regulator with XRE-family HTH domain
MMNLRLEWCRSQLPKLAEQGLSQAEAARKLNVAPQQVNDWAKKDGVKFGPRKSMYKLTHHPFYDDLPLARLHSIMRRLRSSQKTGE